MLRNGLMVHRVEPVEVGAIAGAAGVVLSSLQRRGAGLEEIFLDLVSGVAPAAATDSPAPQPDPEPGEGPGEGPGEAEPTPPAAEPPTSTASFAVAGTGIIDIVPPADDAPAEEEQR